MRLYHSQIRLPKGFVAPTGRVLLAYTVHALEASKNDRYGEIPVLKSVTLDRLQIVEVGVENDDRIVKIVYRGRLDAERDLILVLIPCAGRAWRVKTVWCNLRTDQHMTLDKSRYVR